MTDQMTAPESKTPRTDAATDQEACEWDDSAFRHAYFRDNQRVAMCGYDGPSTHRNEVTPPENLCPICGAIFPEFWDGTKWIK